MTKKESLPDTKADINHTSTESAAHSNASLNDQTSNIVVQPMPTFRDRLQKVVKSSLDWIRRWRQILYQSIVFKVHYSPLRFTRGLTPVRITFSGWGFCIYNGNIKHFHDSDIALKIPISEQTPIIIVGWGQLFKHSLFIDSSLKTTPNFSVRSDAQYACPRIPKPELKGPELSISLPSKTIRVPPSPVFRVNKDVLGEVHRELAKKEDR